MTTCFVHTSNAAFTAFLEKGEPLRERIPQHSVSTKGLGPCASQPRGPFSSKTALVGSYRRSHLRILAGSRRQRGWWLGLIEWRKVEEFTGGEYPEVLYVPQVTRDEVPSGRLPNENTTKTSSLE